MMQESELRTRLDMVIFFKHLEDFQTIPSIFRDEVFIGAFAKAELSNLGEKERMSYEQSIKTYRDLKSVIDTAFDEGKIEGKIETAKSLKDLGDAIQVISQATGLSEEEIEKL